MNLDSFFSRHTKDASVTPTPNGFRLAIPASRRNEYHLAQLDNYTRLPRRKFPHRFLDLSLAARASADHVPGTWGFGVWNDPFGLSLGFGGSPFRLPALPNAAWFFHASPQNYLSFRDDKPAQGFLAQTFRSPRFDLRLISTALALPFAPKTARRLLRQVVAEAGVRLDVNVTQWHAYRLSWSLERVVFEVDHALVLETSISPNPPLGLVIWIDNQYAAFTPEGKIGFGVLKNPEPAWLEIKDLEIHDM